MSRWPYYPVRERLGHIRSELTSWGCELPREVTVDIVHKLVVFYSFLVFLLPEPLYLKAGGLL